MKETKDLRGGKEVTECKGESWRGWKCKRNGQRRHVMKQRNTDRNERQKVENTDAKTERERKEKSGEQNRGVRETE